MAAGAIRVPGLTQATQRTPAIQRPVAAAVGTAVRTGLQSDPFQRDPAVVAQLLPMIEAVNAYFGTEMRGWSHVPRRGPFLIVGNHSGGAAPNDLSFLLGKWVKERGPAAPLYALGYDLLFAYPIVGRLLPKLGVVPANRANARRAFAMGAPVVVFPGGDYEVFRPWSERNRVDFGGHMGFIELAITARVPVIPMTIHGAHQSTVTLTRGERLARLLGMDRLHIKVFPVIWSIPFGPAPAFVPSVQLPSKVTVQFGAPLDWSRYRVTQARDPAVRKRCYDEITERMQETLDALAQERPYPVLSRMNELRPSLLPQLVRPRRVPKRHHRTRRRALQAAAHPRGAVA
jgi:1-acyl-sn-glycerol-3-phosphate acyltransferase